MANSSADNRLTGIRGAGRGVEDLGKKEVVGLREMECGWVGEGGWRGWQRRTRPAAVVQHLILLKTGQLDGLREGDGTQGLDLAAELRDQSGYEATEER